MIISEKEAKKFLDDPNFSQAGKYVEELESTGDIYSIGNIDIDARNIIKRTFSCDPVKCANHEKCRKKDDSCCTDHDVMCSDNEKGQILGLLRKYPEDAAEVMPPSFDPEKIFKPDDDYDGVDHIMKKNTFSACGLSFHTENNEIRCVI